MVSFAFWSQRKLLLFVGVVPFLLMGYLSIRSFLPSIQGDIREEKEGRISSFVFRAKIGDVQILHPVLVTLIGCTGSRRGLADSDRHSLSGLHIYVQR